MCGVRVCAVQGSEEEETGVTEQLRPDARRQRSGVVDRGVLTSVVGHIERQVLADGRQDGSAAH